MGLLMKYDTFGEDATKVYMAETAMAIARVRQTTRLAFDSPVVQDRRVVRPGSGGSDTRVTRRVVRSEERKAIPEKLSTVVAQSTPNAFVVHVGAVAVLINRRGVSTVVGVFLVVRKIVLFSTRVVESIGYRSFIFVECRRRSRFCTVQGRGAGCSLAPECLQSLLFWDWSHKSAACTGHQ